MATSTTTTMDEVDQTQVSRVLDLLASLAGAGSDAVAGAFPTTYANGLRVLHRAIVARGLRVGAAGEVIETWRRQARGRWISPVAILYPDREDRDGAVVRVEGGHVLQVTPEDGAAYTVDVDGAEVARIVGFEEAKAYALARARGRSARTRP